MIPAAAVAAAVGDKGLNTMLVASQVLLSIVLPTVIFPLVYLCAQEDIMTVEGPEIDDQHASQGSISTLPCIADSDEIRPAAMHPSQGEMDVSGDREEREDVRREKRKRSFKSPLVITVLGYALFGIVVVANCYVIVELILGNRG